MNKNGHFVGIAAAVFLLLAATADAEIVGQYYTSDPAANFTTLVQERLDPNINFSWGDASPGIMGIGENTFAVRWEGAIQIPQTTDWTFYTTSDDGVRFYVDDVKKIDKWVNQSPTEHKTKIYLTAGPHTIKFEYFENTGGAVAQLRWSSAFQPKQIVPSAAFVSPGLGLTARYDNDADPVTGAARLVRVEGPIFFDWGTGSPDALVSSDNFSGRWRGLVEAPGTGTFTFYVTSDDGNDLYVNSVKLIDDYLVDHSPTELSGTIDLEEGQRYPIDLRFREKGGGAVCKLSWEGPGTNGKNMVPLENLFPIEVLQVTLADGILGWQNRLVEFGHTVRLGVQADGAQNPPSFQWQFTPQGGGPRQAVTGPGSDTPVLELTVDSYDMAGTYECEVDDCVDTVLSPPFYIDAAPQVPASSLVTLGLSSMLIAAAAVVILRRRSARVSA